SSYDCSRQATPADSRGSSHEASVVVCAAGIIPPDARRWPVLARNAVVETFPPRPTIGHARMAGDRDGHPSAFRSSSKRPACRHIGQRLAALLLRVRMYRQYLAALIVLLTAPVAMAHSGHHHHAAAPDSSPASAGAPDGVSVQDCWIRNMP